MNRYATPEIDNSEDRLYRVGSRGLGALMRLSKIDGVNIVAICDLDATRTDIGLKALQNSGFKPAGLFRQRRFMEAGM